MTPHAIVDAMHLAKNLDLREPLPEVGARELLREWRTDVLPHTVDEACEDFADEDYEEMRREMLAALVRAAMREQIEERLQSLDDKLVRYAGSIARKLR